MRIASPVGDTLTIPSECFKGHQCEYYREKNSGHGNVRNAAFVVE